jgi:hypothetical protein
MKNERATAQFPRNACISCDDFPAVRLMNIHRARVRTRRCMHAKFLRNGLVQSEFFIDLQLDDSDDLPNL